MCRISYALALVAALVAGGAARASDPVGGYLLVDKVILSPTESPTTIQVWGAFALAARRGGNEYASPQRGYLYFKAPSGKEGVCRKEWNDLKKAAGTGQVIGFGTSVDLKAQGTIRKASQKPDKPDVYPVGNGLVKMDDRDYKPVRDLLSLPVPRSPAEGAVVPPGEVTLVVDEPKRGAAKYLFEIVGENGDREKLAVSPRKGGTRWTPKMKVKAGVKYTWSVRVTEDNSEGPAATVTFAVKDSK
jgi:hypothetical protein